MDFDLTLLLLGTSPSRFITLVSTTTLLKTMLISVSLCVCVCVCVLAHLHVCVCLDVWKFEDYTLLKKKMNYY